MVQLFSLDGQGPGRRSKPGSAVIFDKSLIYKNLLRGFLDWSHCC